MNKILIIGTTASSLINFRGRLIEFFIDSGFEVVCLASDYTPESRLEILSLGANPLDFHLSRSGLNPFSDILSLFRLTQIIRNQRPDIVFSYFAKPVIYGSLASSLCRVKVKVGMIEGLGYSFGSNRGTSRFKAIKRKTAKLFQVLLYKVSLPLLDELIFLNNDDPKDLLDAYSIKTNNYTVIRGIGVNIDRFEFTPVKPSSLTFVFVGRLLKEKGIEEFVKCAQIVKQLRPHVKFVAAGGFDENNPECISREVIESAKKDNTVEFLGQISNVEELMKNSSALILPSYYREGLPRTIQESLATGRLVVTYDSVGCRDSIQDEVSGFLVPPFDMDMLVSTVLKIVDDANLLAEMSTSARKYAEENYDDKVINKSILDLIKRNLNETNF